MQSNQEIKSLTSTGMWTVECGEFYEVLERKKMVFPCLADFVQKFPKGRIVVDENIGKRSWFSRFVFGMNHRIIQMHLALEWCNDVASLIYFDDAGSEYRSKDIEYPVDADEETRMNIAHGDLKPHPIEECHSLKRSLNAIEEYLNYGKRLGWLEYSL